MKCSWYPSFLPSHCMDPKPRFCCLHQGQQIHKWCGCKCVGQYFQHRIFPLLDGKRPSYRSSKPIFCQPLKLNNDLHTILKSTIIKNIKLANLKYFKNHIRKPGLIGVASTDARAKPKMVIQSAPCMLNVRLHNLYERIMKVYCNRFSRISSFYSEALEPNSDKKYIFDSFIA